MWASLACALHCALLPLAVGLVPALGLGVVAGIDFDQAFVVFATLLGLATLALGYRRHRGLRAWLPMLLGLALVWTSTFTALHVHSPWHAGTMVTGGVLIAIGHLLNIRLGRACDTERRS